MGDNMKKRKYTVTGMTCSACSAHVENSVKKLPGTDKVSVNLLTSTLTLEYDGDDSAIIEAVRKAGYGAYPADKAGADDKSRTVKESTAAVAAAKEAKAMKTRLIISLVFMILLMYVAMGHMFGAPLPSFLTGTANAVSYALVQLLLCAPILYVNRAYFVNGFSRLFKRAPNMDSLVAVGATASLVYGIFALFRMSYGLGAGDYATVEKYLHSLYFESSGMILALVTVGKYLETLSKKRTGDALGKLRKLVPDKALLVGEDGAERETDSNSLTPGDVIAVKAGMSVPADAVIISGDAFVNESALTGESVPRSVRPGDEIISGCINMSGLLKIRTTREFGESTVSKILDLVENASSRKSKSEDFITKFARIYTPAVVYSAIALAILPPLVRMFGMGIPAEWGTWIYRALTFLVISCPCALVISIPLSFFAGIGGASNAGVLVKGSNYLETLSQTKCVVFDKTGTLTQGVFEVNEVHHNEMSREQLLEYAALAESASSHPISKSLQRAYGKEIDRSRVTDIQEISGNGVTAKVDGIDVAAGNSKLMDRLGVKWIDCHQSGTIIHMAVDGRYAGHIVISDIEKPHAKEAIQALKKAGVEKTVMLTGDSRRVAEHVAADLGIDEVHAELLPADKVSEVEEILKKNTGKGKLAFVGDGINDAPVLSRADIGIAMGAMGSDAAIEAADIVLMDDDPLKISKAIRISRKCLRIVYENIWFAIGIKLICLVLGAVGIANMWLAIFADVGVMIIAVLNAIRALFVKKL